MTQKSKFGGALSIGKKAIAKEADAQAAILEERGSANISEPKIPSQKEPLYTTEDLKQVNAGGLKVAKAVRTHWMFQAHVKGVSLASLIKPALIDQLGLPEGFTPNNLSVPDE